ncbi:MAG: hypothetical protein NTY25_15305 [Planctomycetia bacterium]|nr:hypothetical protein [Planctomycetia bacterium]
MITHSSTLRVDSSRPNTSDTNREREQLRRELLRRIIDRETRRQAMRGMPR